MKKDKKTVLEKNTYVELDVADMTPDGSGVGRTAEGAVGFVPGALAGDRVRAKNHQDDVPATASDASRRCSRRRPTGSRPTVRSMAAAAAAAFPPCARTPRRALNKSWSTTRCGASAG